MVYSWLKASSVEPSNCTVDLKYSTKYVNFFCDGKELEAIKARVKEMEEEAEKLKEMQKQVEESIMSPTAGQPSCKNFVLLSKACLHT